MLKTSSRMYECSCGNWMYIGRIPWLKEPYVMYRSDVEAPAEWYSRSNDIYPGYCRDCEGHYPECRKYCLELE
ncbi:MAG: hypothetical protein IJJ22_05770 [Oscillospiraceae bacterium]|nr:hypothetical protein [Oscillospiraceae bacterium]